MNFSEKLKEIRSSEGLSQEQLAEKIGVSRQAITKWENGKGLPDIENMMIIAEIFKTTIDELLMDSVARKEPEQETLSVYSSETIFDIDCRKHFDINIGSAAKVVLSSGTDEKLHIRLSSATLEDIDTMFKIKLDEKRNKLDVNCLNRNRLSRYEAEESLTVEIRLPEKYADHCEVEAAAKLLVIKDLHLRRLEYDGDAGVVQISGSSGSFEFTAKTDYDISVDRIQGRLDVNQWKAKSVVHIPEKNMVNVVNKGRKCAVYYRKDGNAVENERIPHGVSASDGEVPADGENELSISGIFSELIVDMKS